MIKTLTLKDCVFVKDGMGRSGMWQLFNCTDNEGKRYTSFSNFADNIGKEVEYEVESSTSEKLNPNTNKPYVNYTLSLPKVSKIIKRAFDTVPGFSNNGLPANQEEVITTLRRIEGKIDNMVAPENKTQAGCLECGGLAATHDKNCSFYIPF